MTQVRPYIDIPTGQNKKMRIFNNEELDEFDLPWHKDILDGTVTVKSGADWRFELENEEPIEVESGSVLNVSQLKSRRLVKGTTPLILEITE